MNKNYLIIINSEKPRINREIYLHLNTIIYLVVEARKK